MGEEEREEFNRKQNQEVNEGVIVRIVPLEASGLPLNEWEVEKIKKAAKDKNIEVNVAPLYAVFDLNQNISLVYRWLLEGKDCPFLKNDKCLIYEDRPMRCRSYPLAVELNDSQKLSLKYLNCPNNNNKTGVINTKEIVDIYGNVFKYAFNELQIKEYNEKMLNVLIQQNFIKAAIRQPIKPLLEKIKNNPKIGMFEFIIQKNILTKEQYENNISTLENHKINEPN